ncbi:MAG TPA: proline dehydrogenase family protein [Thermomicrobiales bacterium]|nr:proline dehydrogenase family protein [Thermomicrobiales bacterium]
MSSRAALALNPVFRKGILLATSNPVVSRSVHRYGMRLGASRFVAGETLDECIPVLKGLNAKGLRINTTILGEDVGDEAAAAAVADAYVEVLDRLAVEQINGNVALKLTHLGLNLGEEIAYQNVARLVEYADTLNNFIRIDMEESAWVDATLRIYRRLREQGHDNVGTVLQAYLYRTEQDLTDLLPLEPNLRLVKGAYLEPDSIAFARKSDVDANYLRLAERMLAGGGFTAIATQDERIIEHVINLTEREAIPRDRFEFQMMYGIRPQLQLDLVQQGYRVLVATPYGPDWYHYLMRRLAERPANLLFFARNLVRR